MMVGCIVLALGPTKAATATAAPTSSTTSTTVATITGWTATPLGTVTSAAEHAGKIYIGRDGGYSVRLDALGSLWLFGDTLVRGAPPVSKILYFSAGSSAAVGPSGLSQLATGLREVIPGVGVAPQLNKPTGQPFLPSPKAMYLPGGKGSCNAGVGRFGVRWPTGATRLGTSLSVLITYIDVCVAGATVTVEGWGIAIWSAKTFQFETLPTDIIAPQPSGQAIDLSAAWMSPIAQANGTIDFFAVGDNPSRPGTSLVRTAHIANLAAVTNPASYVGRPIRGPLDGAFPGRLLQFSAYPGSTPGSVLYRAIGSRFSLGLATISTATSLFGPWVDTGTVQLPDCPRTTGLFCWSVIGHPEMSTATSVIVSYYCPASPKEFGHIRLIRLTPAYSTTTTTTSTSTTTTTTTTVHHG